MGIDEMTDKEKAEGAMALKNDPILQDAFNFVRSDKINALLNTKLEDTEARERLYMMLKMLDSISVAITRHIDNHILKNREK